MAVGRIEVQWNGGPSGPGLSVFNVLHSGTGGQGAVAAIKTFFTSLANTIPDDFSLQFPQLVELFDPASGTLTGEEVVGSTPAVPGTATIGFANGVGLRVDWGTATIRNGRRVRGRTFIVPCSLGNFDTNGSLIEANRNSLQSVAATLITDLSENGTPLQVWSRPSVKHPVGALVEVTTAAIPDKPAFLSGRRD